MAVTLIVTALQIEANPIIKKFGLKRDNTSKRIPVYRSDNCLLAISGVGSIAAAIASTHLVHLLTDDARAQAHIFNFGFCGCDKTQHEKGTLLLANIIHEANTGRAFVPDIVVKHDLPEQSIVTVSEPVTTENVQSYQQKDAAFEMEAAGFFQAAITYFATHQIHVLKLVSDHLEGTFLDKATMAAFIEQKLDCIQSYIENCIAIESPGAPSFPSEQEALLQQIIIHLKLTQTQSLQLQDAAMARFLNHPEKLGNTLKMFLSSTANNKVERANILADLCNQLRS